MFSTFDLTERQKLILVYIYEYTKANGFTPTQYEMAAYIGTSRTAIYWELIRLSALGYINFVKGRFRTYTLNPEAPDHIKDNLVAMFNYS